MERCRDETCQTLVDELKLDAFAIKTSFTRTGPDMGSDRFA